MLLIGSEFLKNNFMTFFWEVNISLGQFFFSVLKLFGNLENKVIIKQGDAQIVY